MTQETPKEAKEIREVKARKMPTKVVKIKVKKLHRLSKWSILCPMILFQQYLNVKKMRGPKLFGTQLQQLVSYLTCWVLESRLSFYKLFFHIVQFLSKLSTFINNIRFCQKIIPLVEWNFQSWFCKYNFEVQECFHLFFESFRLKIPNPISPWMFVDVTTTSCKCYLTQKAF